MIVAPLHPNENKRLEALRSLQLLDSAPEAEYQDLAELAASFCSTPIALVSLVDQDRQWFKARVGLEVHETPREISFCAHAILGTELLEVSDARQDPRFADNPVVCGLPGVVFYAGAPLLAPNGLPLGTLCVVDHVPRLLTDAQRVTLHRLSRQLSQLLSLRLEVKRAQALSAEIEGYRFAVKHLSDGLVLQDSSGQIRSFNKRALELLGVSEDDLFSKGLDRSLVHLRSADGQVVEAHQAPWSANVLKANPGQGFAFVHQAASSGREDRHILIKALPVSGSHAGLPGEASVLTTVTDVTEQRLSQQRLLAASRLAAIGELSESLAQEIKTPLAIISAAAEFLHRSLSQSTIPTDEGGRLSAKVQLILGTVLKIGEALHHVHGLLPPALGKNQETLSLGTIASECVMACGERFRSRGIRLTFAIGDSPAVTCFPGHLNQVIIHLLHHAFETVKDIKERWVAVQVDVAASKDEAWLMVSDSGALGEPRWGRVLELTMARNLVETMGGQLSFDPLHKAHNIVVRLPRAQVVKRRPIYAA
jgi:signal transduction histidine kinase